MLAWVFISLGSVVKYLNTKVFKWYLNTTELYLVFVLFEILYALWQKHYTIFYYLPGECWHLLFSK